MASFLSISIDTWQHVFQWVLPTDIFNIMCTCKLFNRIILERIKQPHKDDGKGLKYACNGGYETYFQKWYREVGWDPTIEDNNCLRNAVSKGYSLVVETLLGHPDVDPGANNNESIKKASGKGYVSIVKLLIKHPKVNPRANNDEPIITASKNGHLDVVKLLMEHIPFDQYSIVIPKCVASASKSRKNMEIVLYFLFLDIEFNLNLQYHAAVTVAIYFGNIDLLLLLTKFHDILQHISIPESIRNASKNGHVDVVEYLGEFIQISDDTNRYINESIGFAVRAGYTPVIEKLLAIMRKHKFLLSVEPLLIASAYGHVEIVQLFLEYNVSTNGVINQALARASGNGQINVVKLLLSYEQFSPDVDSIVAVVNALENGHTAVVDLLMQDERMNTYVQSYIRVIRLFIDNGKIKKNFENLLYSMD